MRDNALHLDREGTVGQNLSVLEKECKSVWSAWGVALRGPLSASAGYPPREVTYRGMASVAAVPPNPATLWGF